ncbi:MAG: CPBP family intramembrane glutamic endopeptidase, partial [Desulfovibrionaceae bacterium]
ARARGLDAADLGIGLRDPEGDGTGGGTAGRILPGLALWALGLFAVSLGMKYLDEHFLQVWFTAPFAPDMEAGPDWLGPLDLTFGLALVAVSEEVLSRGVFWAWLRWRGLGAAVCIPVTAAAFALTHWSDGPGNLLAALGFGLVYGLGRWRSGSVWPAVPAHFAIDYLYFS